VSASSTMSSWLSAIARASSAKGGRGAVRPRTTSTCQRSREAGAEDRVGRPGICGVQLDRQGTRRQFVLLAASQTKHGLRLSVKITVPCGKISSLTVQDGCFRSVPSSSLRLGPREERGRSDRVRRHGLIVGGGHSCDEDCHGRVKRTSAACRRWVAWSQSPVQ
jgi:hypothetical protein